MANEKKVRVRFPPSPTGFCHVGTARMATLNYLFARGHDGTIVFRSEDTDKERSKKEYEDDILESIKWLGLSWDEFYRQSERTEIYVAALRQLINADKAYISEEESKKEPGVTVRVVRLRNPGKRVEFNDLIRGQISFDTTELGDFAIARSENDPLYHFAVVVDDHAMGITHVIRGEEHISNTPRQILIQEALGYERPQYAHYALHLAPDRSKLSKRKGDVAVKSYREKGYLPEALLNYIAELGWTPPSDREIMSLEEMVKEFDLKDVHKSGAVFDVAKLDWYNREYLLAMPEQNFASEAAQRLQRAVEERSLPWSPEIAAKMLPLIRERIEIWSDIDELAKSGEFDFFFTDPMLDITKLPGKGSNAIKAVGHLQVIHELLTTLSAEEYGSPDSIKNAVWKYANEKGRGEVLWPMRFALTGRDKSPDPFTVASAVGKEATLRRLLVAISALNS